MGYYPRYSSFIAPLVIDMTFRRLQNGDLTTPWYSISGESKLAVKCKICNNYIPIQKNAEDVDTCTCNWVKDVKINKFRFVLNYDVLCDESIQSKLTGKIPRIEKLYKLKFTDQRIANALKITKNMVAVWRLQHGLTANKEVKIKKVAPKAVIKTKVDIYEESFKKPLRDSESLFCDTQFLEEIFNKQITRGENCD